MTIIRQMLTKNDLISIKEIIKGLVSSEVSDLAIMMKNRFDEVDEKFERIEVILEQKADKTDIIRLENKFEARIERVEDNVRLIKTKLKLS